jgi:hypothetical protein
LETAKFIEGAAVLALGLGLVAEEERPSIGLAGGAQEAFGEAVVAILGSGDFDIAIAGKFFAHGSEGVVGSVEGFVEAGGKEAGLQAGGAQDGLLSEGHAFQSEELLGVDGLVDGDQIGLEAIDFAGVFEANDGERGGGEAVFDGVAGGAGLAFGSFGSGGLGGIGPIGGELFGGRWFGGAWHGASDFSHSMRWGWSLKLGWGKGLIRRGIFLGDGCHPLLASSEVPHSGVSWASDMAARRNFSSRTRTAPYGIEHRTTMDARPGRALPPRAEGVALAGVVRVHRRWWLFDLP